MMWTLENICAVCDGELHGEDRSVDHFVTDSRRIHIPNRTVFIAIKGLRNDGHRYIDSSLKDGVRSYIIDNAAYISEGSSYILVKDSLQAFQALARAHRHSFDYPVIGITGSYGKTMVKDLLASILRSHYSIVRSPRSYNSQTGVPLSIMGMHTDHEIGIFEAGISQTGEMPLLADMIAPSLGIFTSIGPAHDDGFRSRRQKIEEKAQLFIKSDIIVYPRDEPEIHEVILGAYGSGQTLLASWGRHSDSFLHIIEERTISEGSSITYCTGGRSHDLILAEEGQYDIYNSMTILTVLHVLGLPQSEIELLLNKEAHRKEQWEFIRTSYGKGLLVDTGPIDGPSIRTAKEQLNSLVEHEGVLVILSGKDETLANDQRLGEIADETSDCRLIYIGQNGQEVNTVLSNALLLSNEDEFFEVMDDVLKPEEAILLIGEWSPSFAALQSRLQEKSHLSAITINMTSMVHNLNTYREKLPSGTRVMAMVKAFAYGSGEAEVARLLQYHQVDYLTVAYVDEGVTLRKGGVDMPIMVMNSSSAEFAILIENRLEPEIFSMNMLISFVAYCDGNSLNSYPIHLKFDTGMHRLGFELDQTEAVISVLKDAQSVKVRSVFSHLLASENDQLTLEQISKFKYVKEIFREQFDHQIIYHILNSTGISKFTEACFDMVRLGIGLYGHTGDPAMRENLLPVLAWRTVISQIKNVKAGDTVGYGGHFRITEDKTIAIIPIGYADGLSRTIGNGKGHTYIGGKKCPFIGNICMDMSMVDVSTVTCKEGDGVELIGEHISLEEVAECIGTIPYEVLTSIPPRIKRHYIFNG